MNFDVVLEHLSIVYIILKLWFCSKRKSVSNHKESLAIDIEWVHTNPDINCP